jgi:hypothetical protein
VAERIEHLAQHAQRRLVTVLRSSLRVKKLEHARTCYDHRAGTLGVALRDGMLRGGLVDGEAGLALTGRGREVTGGTRRGRAGGHAATAIARLS